MSGGTQYFPTKKQRPWRKWITVSLLVLGFLIGISYALLFIRIVPPRSVRVVDAVTGKPISGMNVCIQAVSHGWTKQALKSDLETTGSNGRAFFGPSLLNLRLLQSLDEYSMKITDPTSEFADTCGPDVGLRSPPVGTQVGDLFIDARRDGTEHFPVELVDSKELPKNIGWYPFMRGTSFRFSMMVSLVPVLDDPGQCAQVHDPELHQGCTQLNTMAQDAMVPRHIGGMERAAVQTVDGSSPGSRLYSAVYQSPSTQHVVAVIERFPKGQNASEHFENIQRTAPTCDPRGAVEEELIPGMRIQQTLSTQKPCAFWASGNRLIVLIFLTPSPFDRSTIVQWLTRHPAIAK